MTLRASPATPVAWRVKDFADGWILFHSEEEARREAAGAGNLVEALYASPASPAQRQRHPRETQ